MEFKIEKNKHIVAGNLIAAVLASPDEVRKYVVYSILIPENQRIRLMYRDQVLQEIWGLLTRGLNDDQRAELIVEVYGRYLSSYRWKAQKDEPFLAIGADEFEKRLHRLARFNLGKSLSARQIKNIKDNMRRGS
jgi:hypothetical protein